MAASTIISGITKTVKYNRANRDYDCFVTIDGGEPLHIGYADSETEGQVKCDQYAFDYLSDTNTPELAAELLLDSPTLGQRLAAARADVLADEDATIIHLDARTPQERAYDDLMSGRVYEKPAADYEAQRTATFKKLDAIAARIGAAALPAAQSSEDEDDGNPLTEEEEAAYDAANEQKVYDHIKAMFDAKETLFVDTLPGRVHGDVPIDLAVMMGIGAAMERNAAKLGITREQLFQILHIAVTPTIEEYLITPARRMRLLWDGM